MGHALFRSLLRKGHLGIFRRRPAEQAGQGPPPAAQLLLQGLPVEEADRYGLSQAVSYTHLRAHET